MTDTMKKHLLIVFALCIFCILCACGVGSAGTETMPSSESGTESTPSSHFSLGMPEKHILFEAIYNENDELSFWRRFVYDGQGRIASVTCYSYKPHFYDGKNDKLMKGLSEASVYDENGSLIININDIIASGKINIDGKNFLLKEFEEDFDLQVDDEAGDLSFIHDETEIFRLSCDEEKKEIVFRFLGVSNVDEFDIEFLVPFYTRIFDISDINLDNPSLYFSPNSITDWVIRETDHIDLIYDEQGNELVGFSSTDSNEYFDEIPNLTSRAPVASQKSMSRTEKEYDESGNLVKRATYGTAENGEPYIRSSAEFSRDDAGHPVRQAFYSRSGPDEEFQMTLIENEYSTEGYWLSSITYHADNPTGDLDPVNCSYQTYDERGFITHMYLVVVPSGEASVTEFDRDDEGNVLDRRDYRAPAYYDKAQGKYTYDASQLVVKETISHADEVLTDSGQLERKSQYDSDGNLTAFVVYSYDDKERKTGYTVYDVDERGQETQRGRVEYLWG